MSETLHSAASDAGTAPRASANVRHLCRMEVPGGGQIVIDGDHAFVGYQTGPEGTIDPRYFRSAQAEDSLDHQSGASLVALAQGARYRRHHGGQFRATAANRAAGGICRRRFSYLRHQGQDQSQAHQFREDAWPRLSSVRSRRELRLHVDGDGRLCRQHPGHLRHPQPVEARGGLTLVDAAAARGRRRDAASARQGASAASRDAQWRQDVRRLLALGRRHRRRERHRQAAYARPRAIRSTLQRANAYVPGRAVPDWWQDDCGVDRGGTITTRSRRRQAARAVPHLGRHRSDQAEASALLLSAGIGHAVSRRQGALRHAPIARKN